MRAARCMCVNNAHEGCQVVEACTTFQQLLIVIFPASPGCSQQNVMFHQWAHLPVGTTNHIHMSSCLQKNYTYPPNPQATARLIFDLSEKQRAVDQAKADYWYLVDNVYIWNYAEVNKVVDSLKDFNFQNVVNNVLPFVTPALDMVSYSAYDSLIVGAGPKLPSFLATTLDLIHCMLPPKPCAPEPRVFIGEIGFPRRNAKGEGAYSAEAQASALMWYTAAAVAWGVSDVFYWQFYDNEVARTPVNTTTPTNSTTIRNVTTVYVTPTRPLSAPVAVRQSAVIQRSPTGVILRRPGNTTATGNSSTEAGALNLLNDTMLPDNTTGVYVMNSSGIFLLPGSTISPAAPQFLRGSSSQETGVPSSSSSTNNNSTTPLASSTASQRPTIIPTGAVLSATAGGLSFASTTRTSQRLTSPPGATAESAGVSAANATATYPNSTSGSIPDGSSGVFLVNGSGLILNPAYDSAGLIYDKVDNTPVQPPPGVVYRTFFRGFWMVDNAGVEQPTWLKTKEFFALAKAYLTSYQASSPAGSLPDSYTFRSWAVQTLVSLSNNSYPVPVVRKWQ